MLRNSTTGIGRPHLPTFADIERRRAELLGLLPKFQPEQHHHPPQPDPYFPSLTGPVPAPEARRTPPRRSATSPKLDEAALHGLAGLAVRTIAPHTEAHPASMLLQLLAVFGNLVGRGPTAWSTPPATA
jgi:hypothetical protein